MHTMDRGPVALVIWPGISYSLMIISIFSREPASSKLRIASLEFLPQTSAPVSGGRQGSLCKGYLSSDLVLQQILMY